NAVLPQDRIGSNNFLKLDYNYKKFTAGLQFEGYLPSIAGYPYSINESKIINRYIKYGADKFSIQVGDFYEQFGSGLVFRSWENRQIGINNALEGVNILVKPFSFVRLKTIYGRQRKILDRSNSIVRGIDAEIDLTAINKEKRHKINISIGGSYVSRYQQYTGPIPDFPATVNAVATRLNIGGPAASIDVEYVHKSKDPNINNFQNFSSGKAILVNGSYAKKNLGININWRAMENLDFRGERDAVATIVPVNFIPALTKQHDYLTTNIYVYNAQPLAETGGQVDLFYNLKGNKNKPSRFAINFAQYRSLSDTNNIFSQGNNKYFQDFSTEWKKRWDSKWTTTLAYHNLFYNKSIVEGGTYTNIKSHIIVLNALYKYNKKNSFRFELQNLFTLQDNGNWFAAVTEFGFAPKWNFFLSDLYNYGITDTHYPTIGSSYTKSGSRFSISYGRQRAGLFCVGGVCRFVPAATGITATLTTTFNN
ncbi:MAG: DUF6029 family protein, partial [Chitinophagaceae bacterium]